VRRWPGSSMREYTPPGPSRAQELMGHADSRTTREVYTHTPDRMVDAAIVAAANALDQVLDQAIGSPNGSQDSEDDDSETRRAEGEGS